MASVSVRDLTKLYPATQIRRPRHLARHRQRRTLRHRRPVRGRQDHRPSTHRRARNGGRRSRPHWRARCHPLAAAPAAGRARRPAAGSVSAPDASGATWLRRSSFGRARLFGWLRETQTGLSCHPRNSTDGSRKRRRFSGSSGLLDRQPRHLSGGEQQRVALGRAWVARAGVWLLDEPLAHLESRLRAEIRAELHLLRDRSGATMIEVTHDPVEALALGRRLAVLRGGTVEQVGPPAELYDRPRTRTVATALGGPPMNLADAVVAGDDGRLALRTPVGWELAPAGGPGRGTGPGRDGRGSPRAYNGSGAMATDSSRWATGPSPAPSRAGRHGS